MGFFPSWPLAEIPKCWASSSFSLPVSFHLPSPPLHFREDKLTGHPFKFYLQAFGGNAGFELTVWILSRLRGCCIVFFFPFATKWGDKLKVHLGNLRFGAISGYVSKDSEAGLQHGPPCLSCLSVFFPSYLRRKWQIRRKRIWRPGKVSFLAALTRIALLSLTRKPSCKADVKHFSSLAILLWAPYATLSSGRLGSAQPEAVRASCREWLFF